MPVGESERVLIHPAAIAVCLTFASGLIASGKNLLYIYVVKCPPLLKFQLSVLYAYRGMH